VSFKIVPAVKDLYKKHKLNYKWLDIYNILISNNHKHKKLLIGYMNYKLKPLLLKENCNILYLITKKFI